MYHLSVKSIDFLLKRYRFSIKTYRFSTQSVGRAPDVVRAARGARERHSTEHSSAQPRNTVRPICPWGFAIINADDVHVGGPDA